MYPADVSEAADRLASFLCGWLGGPKRYAEKYGAISIPQFHTCWPVGEAERDAWLFCMEQAIARQPYSPDFSEYLLRQLRVPAERIRQVQAACPARPVRTERSGRGGRPYANNRRHALAQHGQRLA